jgi:DNA-binding transcriptional LysR family regulator
MDRFKQMETFVAVAAKGSLTAVAQVEGIAAALVGRRIDALEQRLGVKLMTRTTRKLTLTFEGQQYLEECQRLLEQLKQADEAVTAGATQASGHLRVTAPAGFGRKHIAPLIAQFLTDHPEVTVTLDLTDRVTDIVVEGFDLAIRIGTLEDSNLVAVKLASNRRVVVASPAYLKKHGSPKSPQDLQQHRCLTMGNSTSQARGWVFTVNKKPVAFKVDGAIHCNDGAVLHEWALQGLGLTWRSWWEVNEEVKQGHLVTVLDNFAAPLNAVYAVYPQRKHLPRRLQLLIEKLKQSFSVTLLT